MATKEVKVKTIHNNVVGLKIEDIIISECREKGLEIPLLLKPVAHFLLDAENPHKEANRRLRDSLSHTVGCGVEYAREPIANFSFADLFAGVGGFRIALEALGGECVGFSEIDARAIETYELNFPTRGEQRLGDIREIDVVPGNPDLIVGGVPCQSWSIAGKNRGFKDTRGALWGDTVRVVENTQPNAFIFENVKGLADPRHSEELQFLLGEFKRIGYKVEYDKLDACEFGHPQSRVRTYIVGIKSRDAFSRFELPKGTESSRPIYHFLENIPKPLLEQYDQFGQRTLFNMNHRTGSSTGRVSGSVNDYFIFNDVRNGQTTIHSWDIQDTTETEQRLCIALLENRRNKKYGPKDGNPLSPDDLLALEPTADEKTIATLMNKGIFREREPGKYDFANSRISSGLNGIYRIFMPHAPNFSTLTASGSNDYVSIYSISGNSIDAYKKTFISDIYEPENYRKLTKREWARLQGFPEDFVLHESDSASKKQMGNAVPIKVVEAIVERLIQTGALGETMEPAEMTVN